ncbi:MAG: tRNA (adenosine(37)-N6)-threonylcarbamoyltransferase complex dimerization subunit type 1 TsaB [Solirubrobacterales bacterium]
MILGFDTATLDTVVAVTGGGGEAREPETRAGPREDGRPVHGTALLGAIEAAVDEAGGWDSISLIAVGIGPGSFTGLRIGVSTARALAQARGLRLAGVPTTTAVVAALAQAPEAAGRTCLAVLDARRGEIFAAVGEQGAVSEAVVCAPGDLARAVGSAAVEGAIAAGEGSLRFRSEIESAGATVLAKTDSGHRVSARQICRLGAGMTPAAPERIRPLYLRRPDAERWQERDGRN